MDNQFGRREAHKDTAQGAIRPVRGLRQRGLGQTADELFKGFQITDFSAEPFGQAH